MARSRSLPSLRYRRGIRASEREKPKCEWVQLTNVLRKLRTGNRGASEQGTWNWMHQWLCNKGTASVGPKSDHNTRDFTDYSRNNVLPVILSEVPL
ncbi:hypothetical protein SBA5_290151 [Candidatus Sulfotelmatomonas gaucii]|uniref:Uncharacterized protein n=1 Tax=Candidatus Sulfuritelmatomonas gaucii TaxID=2043161 RepID=A0A2N9LAH0_9BACT|nr:hypothetical protein SBA5_290151 [Candidatus Sulfotelmatomonas gaucii]